MVVMLTILVSLKMVNGMYIGKVLKRCHKFINRVLYEHSSFLLSLCVIGSFAQYVSSSYVQKKAGDYIESTSYNDIKRGKPRMLQYLPDGDDFVCVNGNNRYTRALYCSHTAWWQTSDRPIFATYVKNDSRNISFRKSHRNQDS